MAFLKYANAKISKPSIAADDWNAVRTASRNSGIRLSSDNRIRDYSPDKFLLTHCTIIASVDVEAEPKNAKGWPYVITEQTEQFVNNNQDSWERDLLLATYRTFVGGENYVEHIQIPELSKGKIIDAVARDVGESIYVDILVATDRKHEDLVRDIEENRIATLSMGCSVEFTICTKCGNVAEDDTKLCPCIKYSKGNHFFDKKGKRRKIAELCGHKSDPKSVKFIEASWVANPAFKGAVLRNIIHPEEVKEAAIRSAFEAIKEVDSDLMRKAASATQALRTANSFFRNAEGFNFDDPMGDGSGGGDAGGGAPAEPKDPIKELSDELKSFIRNKVRDELREEITGPAPSDTRTEDGNENLVRSTFAFDSFKKKYAHYGSDLRLYRLYEGLVSLKTAGWKSLRNKGYTGREILALSYFVDKNTNVRDVLDQKAYRAIAKVGGTAKHPTPAAYLNACAKELGIKRMSTDMAKALIYKGHLYSYGVDGGRR
jgi:hypothetical protein